MAPTVDPEIHADMTCEQAINALDELCALAAGPDTVHLIEANRVFVGQIVTRAQLLGSLLMARHPKPVVVSFRG